ncbi:MAG: Gfo/Idh/MocA family oxidoreductase [Candidatus Pacearchaeota archaeon]|nr:Gfo/Idh/MocA family oxidoreductase [Candidatus Pacearchaeota archaeon]
MIGIGVIGHGYWGRHLVRNFYQYNGTELIAVSDLVEKNREIVKELYPTIKVTDDYKELLNDPKITGIVIATPVETHYQLTKEALEAGKHVLVEKPLTGSAQQSKELVDLANEKGKVLMVDHTFLYMTETEKMRDLVQSGELGNIYTVDVQRVSLGLFQKTVNVIQDLAPHDISILNYLLNSKPTHVHTTAAYACAGNGEGMEDTAHLVFDYPNAKIVTLHVSWIHPEKKRLLTVAGSKKMAVCDFDAKSGPIHIYNRGADNYKPHNPQDSHTGYNLVQYRDNEILIPPVKGAEALRSVAEEFTKSIVEGRKPKTSGEDGLHVVQILDAALQSMKEGRKIEIKY